ncbi:MAG: citrate transporter [Candidatus Marinimicrobia bacterium]|nr:citrate transporter [Candidatus Neomarinimicrobiota bacterium]
MAVLQITLMIILFLSLALAMFFRKIPALIALPLMAVTIPLICGVSIGDILQYVVGSGAVRLHTAYTVAIFGSMLSILLQKTSVAENFIKIGAELAGDNPWAISVLMLVLITLLFTTLGGLGAIIMVATIVLPIMSSIGIGPMTVIGIFLFGLSMGGILNAGNWALYVNVMSLNVSQIRPFALLMFGITFTVALIYITVQIYRDGQNLNVKKIIVIFISLLIAFVLLTVLYLQLSSDTQQTMTQIIRKLGSLIKISIGLFIVIMFALNIFRIFTNKYKNQKDIFWTAYFSPLIPLFLILLFNMDFIAAFISGLVFTFTATYRRNHLNTLIQSVFEGGSVVMPAVVLMFGIGMLLNAIIGPGGTWTAVHPEGWPVLTLLQPLITRIIPTTAWSYVLLFALAAPLALYRGPLNVWGMGYGLAAVLLASGMNPAAIMGLLMAVGQIQGISDPTNTHNVWLANEMQQDVQKILWNTIPYTWIIAILGLILSAFMFY